MTPEHPGPGVRAVVRNYCRRAPWLDIDDLRQEAAETMLVIARRGTWRADRGNEDAYAAGAVAMKLSRFVRDAANPVPNRHVFCGREDISEIQRLHDDRVIDAEDQVDIRRAVREARHIIDMHGAAARAVLLERRKSATVAADLGIPRRDVYTQTKAARQAIRKSRILRQLMEGTDG